MADHLVRWHGGDEAQIARSRFVRGASGPGVNVVVMWPKIDLLAAEFQGGPVVRPKILTFHAKDALIPGGGKVHIDDIQNDMIDAVDGESHRRQTPSG